MLALNVVLPPCERGVLRTLATSNFLDEMPEKLRQSCLLIKDKVLRADGRGCGTAARYAGLVRGTNAFKDFVDAAVA